MCSGTRTAARSSTDSTTRHERLRSRRMIAVDWSLVISWAIMLTALALFFWLIYVIVGVIGHRIYKDDPRP
jgi:hypothetical protein